MPPAPPSPSDENPGQTRGTPSPERFVWPPKKPTNEAQAEPENSHAPPSDRDELPSDRIENASADFSRATAHSDHAPTAVEPPPVTQPAPRWSRWTLTVEQQWLGLSRPAWSVRSADASWKPDRPGDYCPTCGQSVGPHELQSPAPRPGRHALTCSACRTQRRPWERCVRLGSYSGLLRDAVHEIKFEAWRSLGTTLGRSLGEQLVPHLRSDHGSVRREDSPSDTHAQPDARPAHIVLIPMPTTFRRRMARGIDHTLVIARGVHEVLGGQILRPISRDHRPSQVDVPPSARAHNVAGSFRPKARAAIASNALVILIDDVMTTGATMSAACRALASVPRARPKTDGVDRDGSGSNAPRIWAAVLGVTPTDARRA